MVYPTDDIDASKAIWSAVLGIDPYFDEPFYVGFNVGGYELAPDPHQNVESGPVVYWGVDEIEGVPDQLVRDGATPDGPVSEVGGGIYLATVVLSDGTKLGVIDNPHFNAT